MVNWLEQAFPGLAQGHYEVKSPPDKHYNCIAWAAGDTNNWWWPVPETKEAYWPEGVPREETLSAFRDAFASLGYIECDTHDHEPNMEKIAIFANEEGMPLHAARRQLDGTWTSKLGELEDLEHGLRDIEGENYGNAVLFMKRPITTPEKNSGDHA